MAQALLRLNLQTRGDTFGFTQGRGEKKKKAVATAGVEGQPGEGEPGQGSHSACSSRTGPISGTTQSGHCRQHQAESSFLQPHPGSAWVAVMALLSPRRGHTPRQGISPRGSTFRERIQPARNPPEYQGCLGSHPPKILHGHPPIIWSRNVLCPEITHQTRFVPWLLPGRARGCWTQSHPREGQHLGVISIARGNWFCLGSAASLSHTGGG